MNRLIQQTRLVAAIASLAVATSLASAQTCDPQLLSSLGGSAVDVAIADDIAYVANFGGGLMVVDASDPTNPSILGGAPTGPTENPTLSEAKGVALGNGLVCIADDSGLRVIDAADPTSPVVIGNLDTPGPRDVAVDGHIAYLAAGFSDVLVVDVSDPTDPVILATVTQPPTGVASGIAAADGMAYVASSFAGLQIIDATDPANPVEVAVLDDPQLSGARDVAVQGGFAYVSVLDSFSTSLQIVDVSDPGNPVIVGGTDPSAFNSIAGVAVSGNKAYLSSVANGDTGTVTVVDVSDPSNPQIQGALGQYVPPNQGGLVPSTPGRLAVADGVVWLADLSDDLAAIDVSDPNNLSVLGALPTPEGAELTVLQGNLVYTNITNPGTGYSVVDVSDPSHPVELGNYWEFGNSLPGDFEVDSGLLIASEGSFPAELCVLDVSDPQSLTSLSTLPLPFLANHLDISGDIVCAVGFSGLIVVDISNPSLPSIVGTLDAFGEAFFYDGDIVIDGDVVYITAGEDGLFIVDLSDPSDPTLIGSVPIETTDIETRDGYLFASTPDGFEVLDISIPEAPVQVALLELANPGSFALDGPLAYAFGLSSEPIASPVAIEIIDISDPTAPALVSTYELPFSGGVGIDARDGIVAIGADRQLQMLDVATCVPGQCVADLDGDSDVDSDDLFNLLGAFGTGDGGDLDGDGTTDVADLLELLDAWGPCP